MTRRLIETWLPIATLGEETRGPMLAASRDSASTPRHGN